VRVSIGLSFYDEPSLIEAVGSLRVGPDDPNTLPELEMSIREVSVDNDIGGSDDIRMVDRRTYKVEGNETC
jgi:hypothetical protein